MTRATKNGSKGARTLGLPLVRRALIPAELCFHVIHYSMMDVNCNGLLFNNSIMGRVKDMMMEMDEVIDFFVEVSGILDDNDVETDKGFPERYTLAMNRLRYERDKSYGAEVKKVKSKNSRGRIVRCGSCGSGCIDGNPHYRYCPNCGYTIKNY